MSVNLNKGGKVNLSKEVEGLSSVTVGLGWDEIKEEVPSGFIAKIASLFAEPKSDIDCDATAFVCGSDEKLRQNSDIVYYGNLRHPSDCVRHMGDNTTGTGDGDDERIFVDLSRLPAIYQKIVFVVNIYRAKERHQHFGLVKNAFIRLVDNASGNELCRYNLTDSYSGMTALIFAEIVKEDNQWQFRAIGEGTTDNNITGLAARYK